MVDSRTAGSTNIPIPLTSFVGRMREIAEIKPLLARTRLLTLMGSGGCGKTRLAVEVARGVLPDYAEGVWVTDLAGLSDPGLVPHTVVAALGVPEQPGRSLTDTLIDALRPKSLLLLLDNCEHVLAACGQLADALLRRCPNLRILATSRERFGIDGEVAYRVPSLSLPGAEDRPAPEGVRQYEAVSLFIERATLAHAEFRATNRNLPAVVQVCRRLDGMPLAIELAAARVKVLAVEQIAARLDDRFGLLTGGNRAALARHQTLRATMDWSYDLLSEKEQALLRRLSVFAGGCTLEAIEGVCAAGGLEATEVLDLLTRLVDKSLVQGEVREGAARYTLLETVRQYGRERLQELGEIAPVRTRHRDWYLALAERAQSELHGLNQLAWLDRVEQDHDNLRAALQWSLTEDSSRAATAALGLRLAAALHDFWDIRNHFAEGRAWLDRVLAAPAEAAPAPRAKALIAAALLAHREGDYAQVPKWCDEALAISEMEADKGASAEALHYSAHAAESAGDLRRAAELLESAVALNRSVGNAFGLACSLNCLANTARAGANYPKAAGLYEEALALFHNLGDRWGRAIALHNLGYVVLRRGDRQRSWALFRESLALAEELGDRRFLIKALVGLAGASAQGRSEVAARLFGATGALMAAASVRLEPFNRRDCDHYMTVAKDRLGEHVFNAAWTKGAAMTLEQAMAYALSPEDGVTTVRAKADKLSPREREVASLLAQGLTNRAIASRLILAERTVDTHVEHILNKLGFGARTQIAAWAVEQGLHKPTSG